MHLERFDPAQQPDKVSACYTISAAGRPCDDPEGPPISAASFAWWMTESWTGDPREAWLATGDGGVPIGFWLMELPDQENTDRAQLTVFVHPDYRRRGHGRALLRHAAARAAELNRTLLSGLALNHRPSEAFSAAVGADCGLIEVRRVLDVRAVPSHQLDGLRAGAEAKAAGYTLLTWERPTPEEYLDQLAAVHNAMADAPHSPGETPRVSDAARIRAGEERAARDGSRSYRIAARHDATGAFAALTALGVDPAYPEWGHQYLTAVVREHRGHRLGLLVKVAMLQLLAKEEPELRHIVTSNGDSNRHMIAINESLGFRILDDMQFWDLKTAAAHTTE